MPTGRPVGREKLFCFCQLLLFNHLWECNRRITLPASLLRSHFTNKLFRLDCSLWYATDQAQFFSSKLSLRYFDWEKLLRTLCWISAAFLWLSGYIVSRLKRNIVATFLYWYVIRSKNSHRKLYRGIIFHEDVIIKYWGENICDIFLKLQQQFICIVNNCNKRKRKLQ